MPLFEKQNYTTMSLFDMQEAEDNNQITGDTRNYMLKAGKWMKFMAIIGFIFIGLMIVGAMILPSIIANAGGLGMPGSALFSGFMLVPLLIGIAIVIFPNIFLYQSAVHFIKYAKNSEAYNIETGFKKLAALYLYMGVLFIIYLAFLVIGIAASGL